MTNDTTTKLKRHQIRRLFRMNRGEQANLARQLNLKPDTMSKWMHGAFDSKRIEAAAHARALELLERDTATTAA